MTLELMTGAAELRALVHSKKMQEATAEVVRVCKLMSVRHVLSFRFRTNLEGRFLGEVFKKEGFVVVVDLLKGVDCECSGSCRRDFGTFVWVSAERQIEGDGVAAEQLRASVNAWEAKTSTITAHAVQQKMRKHLKLRMTFRGRFDAATKAQLETQGFAVREFKEMGHTAWGGKYCECLQESLDCACATVFGTAVSAE